MRVTESGSPELACGLSDQGGHHNKSNNKRRSSPSFVELSNPLVYSVNEVLKDNTKLGKTSVSGSQGSNPCPSEIIPVHSTAPAGMRTLVRLPRAKRDSILSEATFVEPVEPMFDRIIPAHRVVCVKFSKRRSGKSWEKG